MNFKDFLNQLDQLKLPQDQYAITASGTMAVRGIRASKDLDVLVSEKLWSELSTKHTVEPGAVCDNIHFGDVHLIGNFRMVPEGDPYSVDMQIKTADIIDGRRYVKLKIIRFYKELTGRASDLKDIELIDNYLKKKQSFV